MGILYEIQFDSVDDLPFDGTVDFSLDFPDGVEFWHQPELTAEEIALGFVRPDNVVDSWAVYYDKQCRILNADGSEKVNYATGKIAHIYRLKWRDANANTVWATHAVYAEQRVWKVNIPSEDWLAQAAFPIVLDPDATIGYTSSGASTGQIGANVWASGPFAAPSSGTITSISSNTCNAQAGSKAITFGVYTNGSTVPNALVDHTDSVDQGTTAAVITGTSQHSGAITSGTNYWVAAHAAVDAQPKYDSGKTGLYIKYKADATAQGDMVDPFPSSPSSLANYSYTIYATYTESGGATTPVPVFMNQYRQRRA